VKAVELYCSSPSVRVACWDDLVEKWAPVTQPGVQFSFDKTPNLSASGIAAKSCNNTTPKLKENAPVMLHAGKSSGWISGLSGQDGTSRDVVLGSWFR
jgi:hypothetical protein